MNGVDKKRNKNFNQRTWREDITSET